MRAFVVTDYAHPSNIPITQNAPEPKAKPGEVLVDVYSAGLNYFDVSVRLRARTRICCRERRGSGTSVRH